MTRARTLRHQNDSATRDDDAGGTGHYNDGQTPVLAPVEGAQSSALSLAKTRLIIVMAVFFIGYLAISLRLIDLTLFRHKSEKAVTATSDDLAPLVNPLRGTIVDRTGELMATSLKMASVYADATQVSDPRAAAKEIAQILPDENAAALEKKLSSGKKFIWLARNITPKQEYAINALGHPGIGFEAEDRRIYPNGRLTAHLLGYTDVDGHGISGIEKFAEKKLAAGEDKVQLTIDLRIQHVMHRELKKAMDKFQAKGAIGMAVDVNTGEIIAMVSLPDFDPYHPGEAPADARFNRASLGVFEMGSTFKLFSTAAALDSGKVTFASQFDGAAPIKIGRFTIHDYHSKNRMLSVPEIFMYSSNLGTAKMTQVIGTNALKSFYKKMGFLAQAPLDLPERGSPLYPNPWGDASTLTASFGHGIAVSPVHLMRAASALVNGGVMITPHLVIDKDHPFDEAPQGEQVIKPETSEKIRKLLALTVADGTGEKAYVDGYDVGGKTGTAEKSGIGGYQKHALLSSFLGVFPINKPRYAVVAILDEPQATKDTYGYATGGWTAAPVVAAVIGQMGPLYQIPPATEINDIGAEMQPYLKDPIKKKKGDGSAANGDH